MEAHAWLRCGNRYITGLAGADRFTVTAVYGDYKNPKEGEWLTDRFGLERSICSICKATYEGDGGNFCPNCGAKMKEGI